MSTRHFVTTIALVLALAACQEPRGNKPIDMKTLASEDTQLRTVRQAPSLDATQTAGTTRGKDEPRQLPFAPSVAMDPVDGSKVIITQETPMANYKDRIYYFSSDATRKTFMADPSHYARTR